MWHTHTQNGALWNPAMWDNMDEPRGHYVNWNKPNTERHMLYDFTYRQNRKKSNSDKQREEWWLPGAGG